MALRLVNSSPGDVADPFIPGTPFVFSLKTDDDFVRLASLQVRVAVSNIVHKTVNGVALLPEQHETLLKTTAVRYETPEHRRPSTGNMPHIAAAESIVVGPGNGGTNAGIYELQTDTATYGDVMASVSFRIPSNWTFSTRYWYSATNLAPLYLGFETGIFNTGIFVALRDDGATGSLVVGGPLHALGTDRPMQSEHIIGWKSWGAGEVGTILFDVSTETEEVRVWVKGPNDVAPVVVVSVQAGYLGAFEPKTSSFSQNREGPTTTATLFFGNGGGSADSVEITDYAIYPNAPNGVVRGEAGVGHSLIRRPDLPLTFYSADRKLPILKSLGMWRQDGPAPAELKFWYQPGRRGSPLYTTIKKPTGYGPSTSYLYRDEPKLRNAGGFSIEAWMAGDVTGLVSIDTGVGLAVDDGTSRFVLTAIDTQSTRTWAVILDPTATEDSQRYAQAEPNSADYRSLRMVRLTGEPAKDALKVYVEDMDTPLFTLKMSDVVYPSEHAGQMQVGHVATSEAIGDVNVASLSYLNDYSSWQVGETPASVGMAFHSAGAATISSDVDKLTIAKTSYGTAGGDRFAFLSKTDHFTFLRGAQVDFRARVASYAGPTGASGTPGIWTGGGVTLFLGPEESPFNESMMVRLGFFDCGAYGRKLAIIPGVGGIAEILNQTPLGKLHSADVDWLEMQSYRLVYRPYHKVEVYGSGLLKSEPLISIPWKNFYPERDYAEEPASVAIGAFQSETDCTTEWEYLRWGVSSGYEIQLTQPVHPNVFDGRVDIYVSAEEMGGGV